MIHTVLSERGITMYYNDAIKQEYLLLKKTAKRLSTIFEKSKSIEESLGKDLAEMDREDVISFLTDNCPMSPATARLFVASVNAYIMWFRDRFSKPTGGKIALLDIDFSNRMSKSYFRNLQELLDEFVCYDFDVGDQVAPILMFCWMGFNTTETCALLESQVDLKNGIVKDGDGYAIIREMSPEILSILRRYKAVDHAYRQRGQKEMWYTVESPYFIRYFKPLHAQKDDTGNPYKPSYFVNRCAKAKADYKEQTGRDSKLDVWNVYWSGIYYRLHQYLLTGASTKGREAEYRIKAIMRVNSQVSMSDILRFYDMYKKAFDL